MNTVQSFLKDPMNKGHSTFNLSTKDKFCGPYRTMINSFTSDRGKYLYKSKIALKLADPKHQAMHVAAQCCHTLYLTINHCHYKH